MIYFELVILITLFIFILCILLYQKSAEGMRVVPRPNRHPITAFDALEPGKDRIAPVNKININDEIDYKLALYFDKDNIPTDYAISKYFGSFVNRGYVSEENKMRMKDFCFYLIQYVIPNIPSETNPNPQVMWPYIEFLSNSVTSYTVQSGTSEYIPFVAYEVSPSNLRRGPGVATPGSNSSSNDGANSNGSGGNGSNNGSNGGNGSGAGCGCPNACFANLLKTMTNSPGSSQSGSSSNSTSSSTSSMSSSYAAYLKGNIKDAVKNSSSLTSIYMRGKGDLRITNEKMDAAVFNDWKKGDDKNIPINDYITGFIQSYFGIDATNPIAVGKPANNKQIPLDFGYVEFNDFIKTRSLIDQRHINILIDLVYYFMENIIPGLPTESVPISYVEWRPIIWSSGSLL
jgi:hypothetical protein